jgi:hypothetical protein
MKKLIGLTAIVILFSSTITAQQRQGRTQNKADFTPEQMATLQAKKMALHLDLNKNQQKEIYDLNLKSAKEREKNRTEYKGKRQNGELTADKQFAFKNDRIERQIAHKKAMKKILNENQYEKWEKIAKSNMKKGKERGMKKGDFQGKQFKNRG